MTNTMEVRVPQLSESVADATLLNWHKQVGEQVQEGENLVDLETDKVTLEVPAPATGTIKEILKPAGTTVTSNEVLATIAGTRNSIAPSSEPSATAAPTEPETAASPKLSPATRKLLAEHRLEATTVPGRAPDRITKEDVVNFLGTKPSNDPAPAVSPATNVVAPPALQPPLLHVIPSPAPAKPPESVPLETPTTTERNDRRVAMTRLRKRASERLLAAQQENAILTTFNEVNMQAVMDLRERYRESFEKQHGVRLGYMSFFAKAALLALVKFPIVNASIEGDDIVYHDYYDLGIAVSAPRGLVVPVIRDADRYSFAGIESKIRELGDKAQHSTLSLEDLSGGTFTITNGGIFGSLLSTPIINPPQSAILGMHRIQERPIAEKGQLVIRPMMYLALSYDHRIIDGREAVQFLVMIKDALEDPARMLLQI